MLLQKAAGITPDAILVSYERYYLRGNKGYILGLALFLFFFSILSSSFVLADSFKPYLHDATIP